jgi:hypothetical protein
MWNDLVDWFAYRITEVLYGNARVALPRKQRIFFRAKKIFAKRSGR